MKPVARSVIALALATSWALCNLWAQQSETELLKPSRVTKHQAKKIALTRVKRGAIKCVELETENGVLISRHCAAAKKRRYGRLGRCDIREDHGS